jgi:hypothetical protein
MPVKDRDGDALPKERIVNRSVDVILDEYFDTTRAAINALGEDRLAAHRLILLYCAIDTCGLLDAPGSQSDATSESFKAWTKKYFLAQPGIDLHASDLWSARCATLHSFTVESRMSRKGEARQLVFYGGEKDGLSSAYFSSFTDSYQEKGRNVAVHLPTFMGAFHKSLDKFQPDIITKCEKHPAFEQRARNLIGVHIKDA